MLQESTASLEINRSPLIQSRFKTQVVFNQMFQNTLMITCYTNFQGAVNTYQKCDQIFLKRKVSRHKSHSIPQLPLVPQLPRHSAVLASPHRAHPPRMLPHMCLALAQGASQVTTLHCTQTGPRGQQK